MKKMYGFVKYMKINGIEDDVFKQVIPHIQHKQLEKGEYIFREGDSCDYFYGLLTGRVSLRKCVFDTNLLKNLGKSN